jgi:hypothetical protein
MLAIKNDLAWIDVTKRAKLKAHWTSRCIANFRKRDYQTSDSSGFN